MNKDFWDPKEGPIFIYICGEWTCTPPDTHMFPFMVGAKHRALLISIEHRFYGESQPFENWTTKNLEKLSSKQALLDIAHFIEVKNEEIFEKYNRKPDWIAIGGSYPGALVAWLRSHYPDHVLGAWSSSGVINAIGNFKKFDESIYETTRQHGDLCPETIRDHFQYVEHAFKTQETTNEIVKIFNVDPKHLHTDDFFFYLADIYTIGV